MIPIPEEFQYDLSGSDVVYGRGCIERLGEYLAEHGRERAMIVCGSNVGANDELMDQVRDGLGDTLVGVFDETTPDKSAETAFEGIDRMRSLDADVIVGLGGGSSLDIARHISTLAADGRDIEEFRSAAQRVVESDNPAILATRALSTFADPARRVNLTPPTPRTDPTDVVVVPTTLAGADVSGGGAIELFSSTDSPTGDPIRIRGVVMPIGMFYDPALFETTPIGALAGSAMNGFNKGIETIYSSAPKAITDATSIHGLKLLAESYPHLSEGDSDVMDRIVTGIILVQIDRHTSIIHAFGHAFSFRYPLQQGAAHAVVAPRVLEFVLSKVDARRELLADAFDVETEDRSADQIANDIVEEVRSIRDSLDVPTRLREIGPIEREDFPRIAEFVCNDAPMERAPTDLEVTQPEVEEILEDIW